MKAKKPQVGDVLGIVFLDHAENGSAMRFEVIGRLFEVTRKEYKVRTWGYVSDVDRASDSNSDNENYYSIVRSAIESVRIYK